MTERLYWIDPYQREFTARVVRRTPSGVVLDRTLFHPTSGGQPHDTGTLGGAKVVDVVEEGEAVVHVLDGPLPDDHVEGVIDWDRRYDHMQQHDGQHILSEACVRIANAETTSFHLGREVCAIDVNKPSLSPADLEAAERLANQVVWENRPIRIGWFTREEAAKLPLRKPPVVDGRIRVVHVEDFDASACCGTHANRSGETGVVFVLGLERGRSESRISFVCGLRALRYLHQGESILQALGTKVSAKRAELVPALEKLRQEGAELRKSLATAEKQLAEQRARELAASAAPRGRARYVVEIFEGRDLRYLQALANGIVSIEGRVAILGGSGESASVVLARSRDLEIDLRPVGKDVFAALGGRGGGQPHFVQGGGPGKHLREALKLAEERIQAILP